MEINNVNTLSHQYEFAFTPPDLVKHPATVGGFGCGKTRSIPLRWVRLIDWRARHQKAKAKIMIVEPAYHMVRDVLVPTMQEFFTDNGIKCQYHKSFHNMTIRLKGHNFLAMFRSADKPSSLTGKNLSDVIIDEFDKIASIQNQREVWNECIARVRKYEHGTVGVVTTPEGYRLTHELWKEKNADNPNFKLIKARTRDNIFLPQDYIDNLVEQYDRLLAAQYLEGEFVNLNNTAAYYCFDRDRHVMPQTIMPGSPLYIGIDFNVNPMTATVSQLDGDTIHVIDEYWLPNSNTRALANRITADWQTYPLYACPDMTGGSRKTSADMTDLQILIAAGFQILGNKTNPTERARLNMVNNILDKDRIQIDPKCKHLINDFEKVITDDYGYLTKEKDSNLTHISDAMGYTCRAIEAKLTQRQTRAY